MATRCPICPDSEPNSASQRTTLSAKGGLMHRSNETSFDHLVGDACKVDGTGAGPALDRCVMGGYSRALRLAYVNRFNRGRRVGVWDRLLEPASRLTTFICLLNPGFTNSVRNLKSVHLQSLTRPHKLRVKSESRQINSGGRSILATLDVRFELPGSLPTSFDTRHGRPADDTSDQMAHRCLPWSSHPSR
jgi:hypothetical protein